MQISVWNEILALISKSIEENKFDTWIKPLKLLPSVDKNDIVLAVENKFILNFLEQHYKDRILLFSQQIDPYIHSVKFVSKQIKKFPSSGTVSIKNNIKPSNNTTTLIGSLNKDYTFNLFVSGPGNEFAKNVSFAVAENPGKTKFNPLLIYGGAGLGKTHLLHAIGNYILNKKNARVVISVTSEEFYFNFIEAIKNSTTKDYTENYRKSDILLVDDIQFMSGKERTQEEFFYIFNTLYQQGKQIVLTSDLAPNTLKGLHDRLISRFQWGLCVDVQPPDLETRVAILKKKAERDNLNIQENILYYIAENITTNIRKLEGIIIRILAFASITKTDISIDLVKNLLSDTIKNEKTKISIDDIIATSAEYYKIPINNMREKNRSKEVSHCRQVAMFISKTYTNYSLKTIGLNFGGRDHSTVVHAIKQISKNKEKDKVLENDINYILSKLGN